MRTALIVIAQNGFQDVEYAGTRKGLELAGFTVKVASSEPGPCVGKFGGTAVAELAMQDANIEEFDRVAFIGGPGAFALRDDAQAQRIAQETFAAGKPLGAICIAPMILAAAGVLHGKKATVATPSDEQVPYFAAAGATYTGEPVTVDGKIVTANGPDAADEFGRTLAAL